MRHLGPDRAPTAGTARVTRTSQSRWTARLRAGLALLDQESRWWRRRQLWSLLQKSAEVRRHRSFDHRASRTTLRETGRHTAADVHQPDLRRAPHEGLVFILSLLSTVDATHVLSLLLGREPQNRGSLVRRWRLGVPGLAQPLLLGRRRSPGGSTGGRFAARRHGAHHAVPHRRLLRTGSQRLERGRRQVPPAVRCCSGSFGLRVVPRTPWQPRSRPEGRGGYHLT